MREHISKLIIGGAALAMVAAPLHAAVNFNSDVRVRYEFSDPKGGNDDGNGAMKLRFRVGGEQEINANTKVKFGVVTSPTTSRSTNLTLGKDDLSSGGAFGRLAFGLDYAYIEHFSPLVGATIVAGKVKNPIWQVSELLFDNDLNYGGIGVLYKTADSNMSYFLNASYYAVSENAKSFIDKDTALVAIQPGLKWTVNKDTQVNTALAVYQTVKFPIKSTFVQWNGEVGATNMGLPYVGLTADVIDNTSKSDKNFGFLIGVSAGDKSVSKQGQWNAKLAYRSLGENSWIEGFSDWDARSASTQNLGVQGVKLSGEYGIGDNVNVGLTAYFNNDLIDNSTDTSGQTLVMADLSTKF